jgi:hypothetical protein
LGLLKWSGTLACLLILTAAFLGLKWRNIRIGFAESGVQVSGGSLELLWKGGWKIKPGINLGPTYRTWGDVLEIWRDSALVPYRQSFTPGYMECVSLPLWIPFVLIGLPTGWLWWRDRRRVAAGCCAACGYDLTGNVSGRCPECGALREAGTPEEVGRPKSEV